MRVLVTGGAGFIGSHLIRRLLADGHAVSVVDNESTGQRENVPTGVRYLRADVNTADGRRTGLCRRTGRGLPYGGAGIDHPILLRSCRGPADECRGHAQYSGLCVKYKVPRLIYASSMTLYGDCRNVPTPETEPCRPDSFYGITKHAAERYVHATAERPDLGFDFRVTSLRMFSVYGPGQSFSNPYQGVLGIFSGNLLRGEPITIYGDGEQTRDFVYVGDIVDGWARALDNPAAGGRVFNLGSGRSLSINQLAEAAVAAFGHQPGSYPLVRAPARPGEQRTVRADIRQASSVLGWEPRTTFETGLSSTIRWARDEFADRPAASLAERSCAMKLLLVTWVDPWVRSVSTVHKWVEAGRALGHEVVVYGEPHPELPALPFTTDLSGVDLALFIVQVPSDFPDMPHLARLLDGVPRERRVVVDLWGRFNDTIRLEHDFNHLEKLDGHLGWEWEDALQAVSTTILQPTLAPRRSGVRSFLFHGYDPASVSRPYQTAREAAAAWGATGPAEKPYGVMYVGSNWQRWDQVRHLLEQYGPARNEIGQACLVGWDWGQRPDWAVQKGSRGSTRIPQCFTRSVSRFAMAFASMRSSTCSERRGSLRCFTGRCFATSVS